jgi:hypothetical protein
MSPNVYHATQELDWFPMDTEELYQHNLATQRPLLEKYNWINRRFTYKFNSHGFRSDEFSLEPSIMFLGCSFTNGIGLPLEDMWTYQVATQLNLKHFNLGVGGSSNDVAFRMAYAWLPQLKPKLVVLLKPSHTRLEILSDNYCSTMITSRAIPRQLKQFYNWWASNDNNGLLNAKKNCLAIEQLCSQQQIKFAVFHINQMMPTIDLARDLAHHGVGTNKLFAQHILENI